MIKIFNLNFDYGSEDSTVFKRVNLDFESGEFALVVGPTGSGKSTLLKTINRLAPTFTGGRVSGQIQVAGLDTSSAKPKDLAKLIGFVNQTPETAFVAETVIEEIAFGMEQLGISRAQMLENIKTYSNLLGISDLLSAEISTLSAGQKQRVAIAACLASGQRALLLDEPTSALDDVSASALLQTLRNLATNFGICVIVSEHRIENIVELADSVVLLKGDGSVKKSPSNWQSIYGTFPAWRTSAQTPGKSPASRAGSEVNLKIDNLSVRYSREKQDAISAVNLNIFEGEIVALVGPNGSGKTTLLEALAGLVPLRTGSLIFDSKTKLLSLVPQHASDLLFLGSVSQELRESDNYAGVPNKSTSGIFSKLVGRINPAIHPRDLSVGQQLALVIAMQAAVGAPVLALDEPTRGLDYEAKAQLTAQLRSLRESGKSVIFATHDFEFAKQTADRVIQIAEGRLMHDSEVGL